MARLDEAVALPAAADRETALLCAALQDAVEPLAPLLAREPGLRLGAAIGTSSGAMNGAEAFFEARHTGSTVDAQLAQRATYFSPFDRALEQLGIPLHKRLQVVAACASSTIAIGVAMRWLERGAVDVVVAGGYDAISVFVAAGFDALRATSAGMPAPFRAQRDGMCLGEGAGIVALMRRAPEGLREHFRISGFGASTDAVHITAPDRAGGGLIRAGQRALHDAGVPGDAIGLVSAHGTATRFNDAMEAKAIAELCATDPVVHPFKAEIGHTLGAAGVLELLALGDAVERSMLPPAGGEGTLDPAASVRLLEVAEPGELRAGLKLSAAFGGVTAALIVEPTSSALRASETASNRTATVVAHCAISEVDATLLAERIGMEPHRLARIDDLGQLGLAALAELAQQIGRDCLEGAGVIAGYALATLDTNERYNQRRIQKGARWVDPRRFPATSPNAGAGQCGIAFDLKGPNFAVCSGLAGPLEALAVAAELINSGDADRIVVIGADDGGPAARAWIDAVCPQRRFARGAVAALLEVGGRGAEVDPDLPIDHQHGPVGHLALLNWLAGSSNAGGEP